MRYAIICSETDPAGAGIKKALVELFDFRENGQRYDGNGVYGLGENVSLYTTKTDTIRCDGIDQKIEADIFIFATRHQGGAGIPSFTAHAPGNWGEAKFGGEPRRLAMAPAAHIKKALKKLEALNTLSFDVMQEATHHGPRMSRPCMFVEIGSTEKEWKRADAAGVVAKVIVDIVTNEPEKVTSAIGIGGPHNCPNFRKVMIDNNDIATGHICAKYDLENLDEEMLRKAIENTSPKATLIILDWKGLGEAKQKIKALAEQSGLEVRRTSDF